MLTIEQVIALLGAKFPGMRKDGIKNLAGVIALQVESEEEARAIVDKLTADKVSAFVTDFRSNIDREIQQSVSTAEQNLRNKYDFVDKGQQQRQQEQQTGGITIDQIKAIMAETMQPFAQRLDAIDVQNAAKVRRETYVGKLKDAKLSDAAQNMMLSQFDRMTFKDDADFNQFLADSQPTIDKMAQDVANSALGNDRPRFGSADQNSGNEMSAGMKEYLEQRAKDQGESQGKALF